MPDINEIELNEEFDFMVIGCDGIFDVLSNEDLFDIWNIVLKECKNKSNVFNDIKKNNEIDVNELCGNFAELIIKSALAKNSFDNVSCVVVVFNINEYFDDKVMEINCNNEIKNKEEEEKD